MAQQMSRLGIDIATLGFKLFFCSGFLLFVVCHYASIQEYAL